MNMPFTPEQFFGVFAAYNQTVWPAQILLNLLGLAAVLLALMKSGSHGRSISGILGFLWLWTAVAYHYAFFSTINPAAYGFAVFAALEGVAFLVAGVFRPGLSFGYRSDLRGVTGGIFIAYALAGYPALGYLLGHVYPNAPTFGAPCPSTIFTFGMLLWGGNRVHWSLCILPFLWSLLGATAALTMGVYEDVGLLLAGVLGTALILWRRRDVVAVGGAVPGSAG